VLSYNGEVGMRFLLILITVLAPLIIPDGGVMRASWCQVTPFEPTHPWKRAWSIRRQRGLANSA
jgi:hypothetical protein